jgi:hypothetical protein
MSTVEVTFTGLFLFAHRGATIWALMPQSEHHPHTPFLYDDDGTQVKLTEPDLDLASTIPAAGKGEIPSLAFPVPTFSGKGLQAKLLDQEFPEHELTGRLKLAQPSFVAPGDTALWKVETVNQETGAKEFVNRYCTNELKFLYNNYSPSTVTINTSQRPFNYTADSDGWIRIHFTHEPPPPPSSCKGTKPSAHHVEAYYKLMEVGGKQPIPQLLQVCPAQQQFLDAPNELRAVGGSSKRLAEWEEAFDELFASLSTFTCLVGSG